MFAGRIVFCSLYYCKAIGNADKVYGKPVKTSITHCKTQNIPLKTCKMQGPILEEVAAEVGELAIVAKLNVDDNRSIAAMYKIQNIPTLLVFKDGKMVKQFVGVQSKQILINTIRNLN